MKQVYATIVNTLLLLITTQLPSYGQEKIQRDSQFIYSFDSVLNTWALRFMVDIEKRETPKSKIVVSIKQWLLDGKYMNIDKGVEEIDYQSRTETLLNQSWDDKKGEWQNEAYIVTLKDSLGNSIKHMDHFGWDDKLDCWQYSDSSAANYLGNNVHESRSYVKSIVYEIIERTLVLKADKYLESVSQSWNKELSIWENDYKMVRFEVGKKGNYVDYSFIWDNETSHWRLTNKMNAFYKRKQRVGKFIYQEWNESGKAWVNTIKNEYLKNIQGKTKSVHNASWNVGNSKWMSDDLEKIKRGFMTKQIRYKRNSETNKLIPFEKSIWKSGKFIIIQSWDSKNKVWKNLEKTIPYFD